MFTIGTVDKHVSKCFKDSCLQKIDLQMHEGMQLTKCFIKTQRLYFCIFLRGGKSHKIIHVSLYAMMSQAKW